MLFERACAALEVPLAIGFARDSAYPVHTGTYGRVYLANPVVWIKRWDTPAHAEGPRALIAGMYGDATCEAVSRALRVAQGELDQRSEAVKVVIYLHDGQPEDESPEAVTATIAGLRRAKGTVILGLFLGDQGQLARMQAIFGREHTIGVDHLDHLPARLGRILARYRQAR
jgi:nitric oxide reductase activation protein